MPDDSTTETPSGEGADVIELHPTKERLVFPAAPSDWTSGRKPTPRVRTILVAKGIKELAGPPAEGSKLEPKAPPAVSKRMRAAIGRNLGIELSDDISKEEIDKLLIEFEASRPRAKSGWQEASKERSRLRPPPEVLEKLYKKAEPVPVEIPNDMSILNGAVAKLKVKLDTGECDSYLDELLSAEEAGKNRTTAISAITTRVELISGEDS